MPTRAGGFLPQHPQIQGYLFIQHTSRRRTFPDRGEDHVGARQRRLRFGEDLQPGRVGDARHGPQHGLDAGQAQAVRIVQRQVGDEPGVGGGGQGAVDQRDAEPAAAQQC